MSLLNRKGFVLMFELLMVLFLLVILGYYLIGGPPEDPEVFSEVSKSLDTVKAPASQAGQLSVLQNSRESIKQIERQQQERMDNLFKQ